jgi:hypothetical protein
MIITWQAQVQTPENGKNFSTIANWWKSLNQKSVQWKQRLIPESGKVDWEPQRFDETVVVAQPDVRGITLYWQKEAAAEESNSTPRKLEFEPTQQQLYIYPESPENLIISVKVAGVVRETLQIKNPAWLGEKIYDDAQNVTGARLTIQDTTTLVEIQVEMNADSLSYLKRVINDL